MRRLDLILLAGMACSRVPTSRLDAPDLKHVDQRARALETDQQNLIDIDAYRELVVVHPSVMLDERASSGSNGPWSFRWLIEQMADPDVSADFVESWLRTLRLTSLNGFPLEDRAGVEVLLGSGPSGWPRSEQGTLDLSRAPFQLLAIVNRPDLPGNGEARFVFGLVDPSTRAPQRMAVAFEYRLPSLGTADDRREWAQLWHSLAENPFGEAYNGSLEVVTRLFASGGADLDGINGSALSQLRMNEGAFGQLWELREWHLDRNSLGAYLRMVATPQTPDQSLNGTEELARFVIENADQIREGTHGVPASMRGGASLQVGAWAFRRYPQIDEPLRNAFARQTCSGCHSSETFSLQGFFHVSPLIPLAADRDGTERLSSFLKANELWRRASSLASHLGGSARFPPPPEPPVPTRYSIRPVVAGEDSAPMALDGRGRVLGNSDRGPWIWDGELRWLFPDDPDARRFAATGFNERGDVVGYQMQSGGTRRAFLLQESVLQYLGTLGGDMSSANAVDADGRIAGDSTLADGSSRAFLFEGGRMRDVGTLGGNGANALAVSSGRVTGESERADGQWHAFLFDGQMREVGSLGGGFARGLSVNDKGQVAGLSELVPGDHKIHAFSWDGSNIRDIGTLPGLPWTTGTGVNNAGVIVGNVYDKPDYLGDEYVTSAFVYSDGWMWNLNNLIPASPFQLLVALGINNQGQILCTDGQSGAPRSHGFVLSPQ